MRSAPANPSDIDDSQAPRPGIGGRMGLTLFSAVFLAFGILATTLVIGSFSKTIAQRSWSTADCVITRSTIADNQKPSHPNYRLNVAFAYGVGGRQFTATQLRNDYSGSGDYYDAQKLQEAYPVHSHATCWIDPAHPDIAVLQRSSLFGGLFALIPLAFLAVGVGGIYAAWFQPRRPNLLPQPTPQAEPRRKKSQKTVGVIFFVLGISIFMFVFLPIIHRGWNAANWPQVPCTIIHSGISSHSGSKGGTTYGVEVLYRYRFGGTDHASSKYNFMNGSSSNYYAKQDLVRSLPTGKKTVCFVDPHDPAYAVLDRNYHSMLLLALIPLSFAIFGAVSFITASRIKSYSSAPSSIEVPGSMMGNVPLTQTPTPAAALMVAIILAAFWNGIVAIFVNQLIVNWKHGEHDYFLALFLVPFVFVGVLFIVNIGYRLIKCF